MSSANVTPISTIIHLWLPGLPYPNKDIEISWLSGIMPAEKMEADELSYSSDG